MPEEWTGKTVGGLDIRKRYNINILAAKAIAKDAGLIKDDTDIAMSAIDFDALSDEEAKEKLPHIKVIARATPNTKLRIVRLAQELGLCVGMTVC